MASQIWYFPTEEFVRKWTLQLDKSVFPDSHVVLYGDVEILLEKGVQLKKKILNLPNLRPGYLFIPVGLDYGSMLGVNTSLWNHATLVVFDLDALTLQQYDCRITLSPLQVQAANRNLKHYVEKAVSHYFAAKPSFKILPVVHLDR
jgi:hypothetical protein